MKKQTAENIKAISIVNLALPVIGAVLMIYYNICNTSCSSLQGTLLGFDLAFIGILFMILFLTMAVALIFYSVDCFHHFQSILLSAGLGGEIILIRFQIMHKIYCPYCLAFGMCIIALFAINFAKFNRWLVLVSFIIGFCLFDFFFEGSVLALY